MFRRALQGEVGFYSSFTPFLWTKKGSLQKSTREAIPVEQAYAIKMDIWKQQQEEK